MGKEIEGFTYGYTKFVQQKFKACFVVVYPDVGYISVFHERTDNINANSYICGVL